MYFWPINCCSKWSKLDPCSKLCVISQCIILIIPFPLFVLKICPQFHLQLFLHLGSAPYLAELSYFIGIFLELLTLMSIGCFTQTTPQYCWVHSLFIFYSVYLSLGYRNRNEEMTDISFASSILMWFLMLITKLLCGFYFLF